MKFGIWLPAFAWEDSDYGRVKRLRKWATTAEELGFDSLWVIDRLLTGKALYQSSWLEPLTFLAHIAACTRRIKIGTAVLVLPLRHPVLLAKEVATLDYLSEGRFVLGAGLGWYEKDYEAIGVHLSERGERTDECLAALRLLLSEPKASFEGKYYRFQDVTIEPRPSQVPPIWIAGGSRIPDPESPDKAYMPKKVLERITGADGFLIRSAGNQEFVKRDLSTSRESLKSVGRDLTDFPFALVQFIHVVESGDRDSALAIQRPAFERLMGTHRSFEHLQQCYLMGTVDEIVERIKDLARAGLSHLILGPVTDDTDQLELIAKRIVPSLVK